MTYDRALEQAKRQGASKATGDAALAQACSVIALAHPGTTGPLLYAGAKKLGLSDKEVLKASANGADLVPIMFA